MTSATKWACGLWLAFVVALGAATYTAMNPVSGEAISVVDAIWAASFVGFPTAGAIVVSRMPRRPLGWMLLVAPLFLEIGLLLDEVSLHFLDDQHVVASWMVWTGVVCFDVALAVLVAVPLFLPNGQLPSARWKWVGRSVWVFVGLMGAHAAFRPGRFPEGPPGIRNPLGIDALASGFRFVEAVLGPMTLAVTAVGVVSLFARFRSSRGVERQQLKWLALGGGCLLTTIAILMVILSTDTGLSEVAITLLFVFAILSLPVSIAVAVLKTRLYDVDVVINKTLVYGSVSAVLALSYLMIVVVLQALFGDLVRGSDLAVAASTLVVAALFRPMRARVQGFIDRRFYRSKYNAAATLDEFSGHLRDQVDLEALNRELIAVVARTMQPAHASLWLRGGEPE